MRITIVLHRQTKEEPGYGTFRAYVLQEGRRGANLLGARQMSNIEHAKRAATDRVAKWYPGQPIEWQES